MLTTLRIKNLALVAELSLELPPGLVVITGETGAGKSIILGALNLVLGQRADRSLIRAGAESCLVEAAFDARRVAGLLTPLLAANGLEPCEDNQLLLKRTFSAAGTNRQFINGTPTTLNVLAEIGEWLVDIHGPHEHQSLLHPSRQLAILDAFGGLEEAAGAFGEQVKRRAGLVAEREALTTDVTTLPEQLELVRFQAREIVDANLRSDEEADLQQDYQRASNAARLLELSHAALSLLGEDEHCLLNQTGALARVLQDLRRLDPAVEGLLAAQGQAADALRELQGGLRRYADQVEVDPDRLQALEERLNLLQALRRKYGGNIADVIAFGRSALERLAQLEHRQERAARLDAELERAETDLWRAGSELSVLRRRLLPRLSQAVSRHLADLGFPQSNFTATFESLSPDQTPATFALSGLDRVEFLFAPNPGEPARPLRAIASSGELARVMLALKTVLAVEDQIPVLVFDEVDANVGGETALKVGEKMRQIARHRQVFCVTHLPQVAAAASAHWVVTKEVEAGRTLSQMRPLTQAERVGELARMLGGQSDSARRHAAALLAVTDAP